MAKYKGNARVQYYVWQLKGQSGQDFRMQRDGLKRNGGGRRKIWRTEQRFKLLKAGNGPWKLTDSRSP